MVIQLHSNFFHCSFFYFKIKFLSQLTIYGTLGSKWSRRLSDILLCNLLFFIELSLSDTSCRYQMKFKKITLFACTPASKILFHLPFHPLK